MGMELVEFKKNLGKMIERGELALPSNVDPESFRNAAIVAYHDSPQIAKCVPESIFRSIRKLAGMGLVPDGAEAALVPYKHQDKQGNVTHICQAIPMVAGLIKRARNSAEIQTIWAEMVYEGEEIVVWPEGGERKWDHKFDPFDRGGTLRGAYAVAKLRDGTVEFEPMSRKEIEQVREMSAAKNGPAWRNWYTEMAKKTVIRRLIKRLPVSAKDRRVILESDSDTIGDMKDVTPERKSLQERVEERRAMTETAELATGGGGQVTPENHSSGAPSPDESSEGESNAGASKDQKESDSPSDEVEDAEVVDDPADSAGEADGHIGNDQSGPDQGRTSASPTFTPNPDAGFPMDDEFGEGWKAYEAGDAYEANPYVNTNLQKTDSWAGGWIGSKKNQAPKKKGTKA